jgi:hypothetical protein
MFAYGVSICLRATYIALAPCANEGLYSATALEIIPKSSCSPIENPLLKILSATRNKIINTSVLQFLSIGVTMHAHWYCQAFDDFICRPSGNDF